MSDFLQAFDASLADLLGEGDQPVVVSSAMWPVLREMRRKDVGAVDEVLDCLQQRVAGRDLLMPTFTDGYGANGVCDLDHTSGTTGVLNERFRLRPGVTRSLSAFFSYAIDGPSTGVVGALQPEHAWGDGSLYDWMEQRNARFLLLGAHPTHCSYLHRLEWLVQGMLPYRYCKPFSGTLIRGGQAFASTENLFVRCLQPAAINDFTTLMPLLEQAGMRQQVLRGVSLAVYAARAVRDAVLPVLHRDPLRVLRNRADFEKGRCSHEHN